MHAFPWREEESLLSGEPILRPTVDVQLSNAELVITTKALVDTGAPRCVFPRVVAELIGVTLPHYPSDADKVITLMGRDWPAVTESVGLLLRPFDNQEWTAEVDFVMDDGLPIALLGYEGFLNRWAVSFNGYVGYFIVEPVEDFEARQPREVLDELRRRWPGL